MASNSKKKDLELLFSEMAECKACELYKGTTQCVPPVWRAAETLPKDEALDNIRIMYAREAAGAEENLQGKPFIGPAGIDFQKTLLKLNSKEHDLLTNICITNVAKHRPPNNRKPTHSEMFTCGTAFLLKEIYILKPKLIICLGRTAAEFFLGMFEGGFSYNPKVLKDSMRGKEFTIPYNKKETIPVFCTWHPAYILRREDKRPELEEDLLKAVQSLSG